MFSKRFIRRCDLRQSLFLPMEARTLLSAVAPSDGDVSLASGPGKPLVVAHVGPDYQPVISTHAETAWSLSNMQALGIGPRFVDDVVVWVDARTARSYAIASSPAGFVLLSENSSGGWSEKNLNASLPAEWMRLGSLVAMAAADSRIFVAGLSPQGDLILVSQDDVSLPDASTWSVTNLSETDLVFNNAVPPRFSGPLSAFVTLWGTLHICGVGDDGDLHVVWRSAAPGRWQDANLSSSVASPDLVGVATPFLSSWGGIHIASADSRGHVVVTWWVPGFGGDWRVNDLTAEMGFSALQPSSLVAYSTRWDGLNIAGLDESGNLLVYWWAPVLGGQWLLGELATPTALSGRVSAHADPFTGDLNIVGVSPEAGRYLWLRWTLAGGNWAVEDMPSEAPSGRTAVEYLAAQQDAAHERYFVYRDADDAANHFAARGRFPEGGSAALAMDETWTVDPHSGNTSIRARADTTNALYGGWYFLSGTLNGSENGPQAYWGTRPREEAHAGINLFGATELTFWAKGAQGGEVVEFFMGGVGWNADTGVAEEIDPDSSPKRATVDLTLGDSWRMYRISLAGADLSYTLGGFGWKVAAASNSRAQVEFFIDDISFDLATVADPAFITSYDTIPSDSSFDRVQRNAAYSYDNALAILAFLADGKIDRAKRIADAFVYAQNHDRFYSDGRIRNAYQGGDLLLPPGWTPNGKAGTVRMPGWYDEEHARWLEDLTQVSTSTGNMAWVALALLATHRAMGVSSSAYLAAAVRIAEWVESNTRDDGVGGGYRGGTENFDGLEENWVTYKSTEHCIDWVPVAYQLDQLLPGQGWDDAADHARAFLSRMWGSSQGKFWTGTQADGITVNTSVIPVDIQAWSVLALRQDAGQYVSALSYAESSLSVRSGFDFNQDRDAIWYEGTAQMASAYREVGQAQRADQLLSVLVAAQRFDGAMPASERATLTTGFDLATGGPWLYFRRVHVGATAWLALAESGENAYWV